MRFSLAQPLHVALRGLLAAIACLLWMADRIDAAPLDVEGFERLLATIDSTVPLAAGDWDVPTVEGLSCSATQLDTAGAELATFREVGSFDEALAILRTLLDAKQHVDRLLDAALDQRRRCVPLAGDERGRDGVRAYLAGVSRLIDLSGRLRYLLADAITTYKAGYVTSTDERRRLIELLAEHKSSIGAFAVVDYLSAEASPSADEADIRPAVLKLIAESRNADLVFELTDFASRPDVSDSLVLQAVETIRTVGLPQTSRPDTPQRSRDPAFPESIRPEVRIRERLAAIAPSPELQPRQQELLAWLDARTREGLPDSKLRIGNVDVQPGDWLLMRNPSPYNLFTDLAPGLFTHVGVVAEEQGSDGVRRLVVLDLTERGKQMQVTPVDAFLKRTLHYAFLRHPDAQVRAAMAEAARSMIGNEIEFDMTFRTARALELAKTSLAGKKIHTYCAGLLLLCALQTDVPREEFFPVAETPAPGHTVANLAKLGMSIGDDFISPTGALFSPRLELVGRREPMYDPSREIEEAVFDHFAKQMREAKLSPRPDLYNDLRLKLAEASQQNPLLAEALSRAVDVNIDLVAAAKAGAVIETLDEIAFGSSDEFLNARDSLRAGPLEALQAEGFTPDELAVIEGYRRRHAELFEQLQQGKLSPRELRIRLVDYYSQAGKRQLDEKFFGAGGKSEASAIQNPKSAID